MRARPPALLLIDFQNDYFPGGSMALEGMEGVARNAAAILARFRSRDWPRFHIQHVATRAGAGYFVAGTAGADVHAAFMSALQAYARVQSREEWEAGLGQEALAA